MIRYSILIFIVLLGCKSKQKNESQPEQDSTTNEVSPADAYEKTDTNYDYREFFGTYDHESTTTGFSAVLSLKQNGRDLYFTLSVLQGDCKKEMEGVVMVLSTDEQFPTGFYQSDSCRLQFTFAKADTKVDVKEITFCGLDGSACSFEGTYKKRVS